MVTLACGILGADISASGRRLLNLGITDNTFDDTYARLSHSAKHGSASHAAAEGSS